MRAVLCSCGLDIRLSKVDKEQGEKKGKLECQLNSGPKVVLYIVDEVPERGPLEAKGFHIEGIPLEGGRENRERYDIYLSKERFQALTNPEGNPITDGGYFVSRSFFDRIEFRYYGL